MDGRNEQTEIEDHTLVDIEEQATQHVVTAMKGKLQSVSGRQKTMDGRNEQTEMSDVNIAVSSSHGIPWNAKRAMKDNLQSVLRGAAHIVGSSAARTSQSVPRGADPIVGSSAARTRQPVPPGASPAGKDPLDTNEAAYVPRLVPKHREKDELATQQLVTVMKLKLRSLSDASEHRCIYRVPKHLRDTNEAAYVPRLVPKHREKDELATQQLVTVMKLKLRSLSDASEHRCIYRVPKHLRDTNEAANVPRLVSLGPFHHGNENLKAMEEHKWRCFKSFIEKHQIDLDVLVGLVKGDEKKTREYYAYRIELSSDQFVQVILVDAIFVINFLLQFHSLPSAVNVGSIYHDEFFWSVVSRDMMLLENQLPLFILDKIIHGFTRTDGTKITELPSVFEPSKRLFNWHMKEEDSDTKLCNCLFNCHKKKGTDPKSDSKDLNSYNNARHMKEEDSVTKLCNCLFNCHKKKGTDDMSDSKDLNSYNNARHFVDFQKLVYMPVEATPEPKNNGKVKVKSISKLHEAGVRFKVASGKKLFRIDFKDGVLEIPGIVVADETETIFRNLLAYDQCHYGPSPIGDYFVLMGMLIDTADDVDLLVKNEILQNDLATAQEVSKVFNSLEKEVFYKAESFYYSYLCEQLNDFCEIPWHKWMAGLKQNYLDTPWKVMSLIVAFILLVLTMIQTVCSVISL